MLRKLVFPLACITALAFGQNKIDNASFEELGDNALPSEWRIISNYSKSKTHSVEKEIIYDGKGAVRIENLVTEAANAQTIWQQPNQGSKLKQFPIGTKVELSVLAYAVDKPAKGRIYIEGGNFLSLYEEMIPENTWKKITTKFTIAEKHHNINPYVCLQLLGNGSIVFDCVYMGVPEDNPWKLPELEDGSFITNGGAEKQLDGGAWSIVNETNNDGKAFINQGGGFASPNAFSLNCVANPNGTLAWKYDFQKDLLKILPCDTEMALVYDATVGSNPSTTFQVEMDFAKDGQSLSKETPAPQTVYAYWKKQVYKFKTPAVRPTEASVTFRLVTGGVFSFDNVKLIPASSLPKLEVADAAKDYCRMLNQPLNSTFIKPRSPWMIFGKKAKAEYLPKEIEIECYVPDTKLHVELAVIDGEIVKSWDFDDIVPRNAFKVKLDLPKLAPEAYELKYTSGNLTDFDWFRVREKDDARVKFNEDGILLLDGKPFFLIGVCTPSNKLDFIRVYSESGINTTNMQCAGEDTNWNNYCFDVLEKFNMKAFDWCNWGWVPGKTEDEIRKEYIAKSDRLKNRDGFICNMTDEVMWGGAKVETIRKYRRLMFKYCPEYPAWLNHAPRLSGKPEQTEQSFDNGRRFSRAADCTGLDIYPIPEGHGHNDLPNRTMSCVGEYVDTCRELTWDTKPVMMILQAFGWSEEGGELNDANPRPTEKQLRFMIWNAITHGARGIVWYGAGLRHVYCDWWRDFAKVNLELKAVSDLMIASKIEDIHSLPKDVRGIRGNGYEVYVNENNKEAAEFDGKTLEPQGVLLLVDGKPLEIQKPALFVETKQTLPHEYPFEFKDVTLKADWVAHPDFLAVPNKDIHYKQSFTLDAMPKNAVLTMSAKDKITFKLNGNVINTEKLTSSTKYLVADVAKYMKVGENTVEAVVHNNNGLTGLRFEFDLDGRIVSSGESTLVSEDGNTNWIAPKCLGDKLYKYWWVETLVNYLK